MTPIRYFQCDYSEKAVLERFEAVCNAMDAAQAEDRLHTIEALRAIEHDLYVDEWLEQGPGAETFDEFIDAQTHAVTLAFEGYSA